jgi:sulfite reductase (NADPH) flavoprotein alpha-component
MKKSIYKIHKYCGITLGVLLFLSALSGVGISFREELMPIVYKDLFAIEEQETPQLVHELYTKAQNHLGQTKKITNIYGPEDKAEAYLVLYKTPEASFPGMLTINPYTGAVVGEMSMIKNFFAIMLFMHSNLFLGKVGSYIVGVLGLVLIFFVISGIYIWLPQRNSILHKIQRTFEFSKNLFVQKLHHTLGLTFSLILLISAVTGFLTIFDISYQLMRPIRSEAVRVDDMERKSECSFEEQLAVVKNMTPLMEKNLISIHFCTAKNGLMKVSYGLHNRNFLDGYGRIVVDPKTNQTLQKANSEKDPSSWNIKRLTIYPIHTGEYLGMFGRVIVFISGFALMTLFWTGLTLYLRRRRTP